MINGTNRLYRPTAATLAFMLLSISFTPAVAAACEGGLSTSASSKSVTIPNPKSGITIEDISPLESAEIANIPAKEEEVIGSQWAFKTTICEGMKLVPFKTCFIPVSYVGELNSKVTFTAFNREGIGSNSTTITAVPPIQVEPPELAYKTVTVGTQLKKLLKIKANEKVQIKTIRSTGSAFKVATDSCKEKTLEASNECAVEVGFTPKEKIHYANTLEIPYKILSISFISTREIPLTGDGG